MIFEQALPVIDILLKKNRHKWQLTALNWISFEDIEQVIRLHLFKKFHLYDQDKDLEPWVNTIINNQLLNLQRNYYYSSVRPCLRCDANEGGDLCEIYVKQCADCPIYAKWAKTKKYAQDINLPVSSENHQQEINEKPQEHFDIEKSSNLVHVEMKKSLTSKDYLIYQYLFIEHLSESETASKLGFKINNKNKQTGYSIISNAKKRILKIGKEIIKEIDLY